MATVDISTSDGQTNPATKRGRLERQRSLAKVELASFITHYKELSQFYLPRRGRFFVTDHNKGDRRHRSIINSKGTMALNTAAAGMIAGTMSPSQPWFKTESYNPALNKRPNVKLFFYYVDLILREIFNSSNLYAMASPTIKETLLFGTGCLSQVDDFENVARFYSHTAGSYMIAQNDKYEVDTVIREFEMTASQIVSKFSKGKDASTGKLQINPAISPAVQNAYALGNYGSWFPVVHITEPNELYAAGNPMAKYKRFASCYYEPGNPDPNAILSESGFEFFPFYVPRWDVTGEDIYGTDCPGMTGLGDVKALQLMEKRKAQALDKIVSPPLKGPPSLRNVPLSSLPGGANIYTKGPNDDTLGPLYQIQPQLGELRLNMQEHEKRIDSTFYVDMFLSISTMEGVQPQNELYLSQRNQERLLQLGPVLERIHGDFLSNMISRTFYQALTAGILPPIPPELRGQALKVRYISTMAQAQRSVGTSTIDRYAAFAGGLVKAGWTDAALKFNATAAMDVYGDDIGVPPEIVNSDDNVAAAKQAQAQAVQEQQQSQAITTGASAFKDVGSAVKSLSDPASRASITGNSTPGVGGRNNI